MKVLLWLATGAGKTWIFCKMTKESVSRDLKVIILVRGRKLVDQASQRLLRERVSHGVMMAGHWNYRPNSSVQVCSIDTLIARGIYPDADLIIIDEADLAVSKGFNTVLDHPKYKDSYIVSCTATPWVEDGLRHIADSIVHPITMEELIEQGYLCGFTMYGPDNPDMSRCEISRSTKDYMTDQSSIIMSSELLTGNIVKHWKDKAFNRPTICFATNVKHSKLLTERFNDEGIRFEHLDADSTDGERNSVIGRVQSGETRGICNVGIAGRGVDIPCISAVIQARPWFQRNGFVQQCGRGTRLEKGKTDCVLLDHAGNWLRHGFPTDEPEVFLDGAPKTEKIPKESKRCPNCFAIYRGTHCQECGHKPLVNTSVIGESEGELKQITKQDIDRIAMRLKELKRTMSSQDAFSKLFREFGDASRKYMSPMYAKRYDHKSLIKSSRFERWKK
jgi:superfamily II DNA or RNA helicase